MALMSREQYDKALAQVIREHPAGAHEGWQADFLAFFDSVNSLPDVKSGKARMTGNPLALIEVRGRLEWPGPPGQEVGHELARIWVEELVFRKASEEHTLSMTPVTVTLEAYTITRTGHYVSARVIVDMI